MNEQRKRIIIAGSRDGFVDNSRIGTWVDWLMRSAWDQYIWRPDDIEIVSGAAAGIDACGERYSREVLGREPTKFPADWNKHGKAAGNLRNEVMALYADAALVFLKRPRPSPGSSNMYTWMGLLEKPAKVVWV